MPGYSGTPLVKKLGIKPGFRICIINTPRTYTSFFNDFPEETVIIDVADAEDLDFIHLFARNQEELERGYHSIVEALRKNGMLWVSWPKSKSGIPTDLKREPIREYVLAQGLVDVKVAAVDEQWSGLKFVYRLKDR